MTLDYITITYPDGNTVEYSHMQVFVDNKPMNVFMFRKKSCSVCVSIKHCEHGALELAPHDISNLRMTYTTLEKLGISYEEIEKD